MWSHRAQKETQKFCRKKVDGTFSVQDTDRFHDFRHFWTEHRDGELQDVNTDIHQAAAAEFFAENPVDFGNSDAKVGGD